MLVAPVVTFNPSPLRKYRARGRGRGRWRGRGRGRGRGRSRVKRAPGLASACVPLTSKFSIVHIMKKPQALIF